MSNSTDRVLSNCTDKVWSNSADRVMSNSSDRVMSNSTDRVLFKLYIVFRSISGFISVTAQDYHSAAFQERFIQWNWHRHR